MTVNVTFEKVYSTPLIDACSNFLHEKIDEIVPKIDPQPIIISMRYFWDSRSSNYIIIIQDGETANRPYCTFYLEFQTPDAWRVRIADRLEGKYGKSVNVKWISESVSVEFARKYINPLVVARQAENARRDNEFEVTLMHFLFPMEIKKGVDYNATKLRTISPDTYITSNTQYLMGFTLI